jgi:hypothetical protein
LVAVARAGAILAGAFFPGGVLPAAAFLAAVLRGVVARLPAAAGFAALVALIGVAAAFRDDVDADPLGVAVCVVVDDFAAFVPAGAREIGAAFVVARLAGRAVAFPADAFVAFAAGAALVALVAGAVPDRVARPPRPTAAMAIPSWLDRRWMRCRVRYHRHRKGGQGYELGPRIATGLAGLGTGRVREAAERACGRAPAVLDESLPYGA